MEPQVAAERLDTVALVEMVAAMALAVVVMGPAGLAAVAVAEVEGAMQQRGGRKQTLIFTQADQVAVALEF